MQARGFWRQVVPRGIGAPHDQRQPVEARCGQLEMADDGVEGTELALMGEGFRAWQIVGGGAEFGRLGEDLAGGDVDELGIGLDEAPDQPGAGDAIDLRALAGNPLRHHTSPRFCSGVSGTVGPPMACQAAMPPTSARVSRPRRRSSAVASPLTWKPYSQ